MTHTDCVWEILGNGLFSVGVFEFISLNIQHIKGHMGRPKN